jgi:branched-chain amino acid transport system ATP-binding protein
MPEALLRTEALSRSFGSLLAVHRVDITVHTGELRSIIGPNGAGKTTFFRLISGEMAPSGGRVWFKGRDITGLPQHAVARLGITKSYQITNVFPHLTVHENVRVAVQGWTRSFNFWSRADRLVDVAERAHAILRTVGLTGKAALLAAHLSHGEKRHLEIGIALASNPELLLLDEPTAGMSPEETDETMGLIRELTAGRTVVLVEHKMKLVMRISDRITVLHQGQVIADGTPAEIRANERVQQTYLGAVR